MGPFLSPSRFDVLQYLRLLLLPLLASLANHTDKTLRASILLGQLLPRIREGVKGPKPPYLLDILRLEMIFELLRLAYRGWKAFLRILWVCGMPRLIE